MAVRQGNRTKRPGQPGPRSRVPKTTSTEEGVPLAESIPVDGTAPLPVAIERPFRAFNPGSCAVCALPQEKREETERIWLAGASPKGISRFLEGAVHADTVRSHVKSCIPETVRRTRLAELHERKLDTNSGIQQMITDLLRRIDAWTSDAEETRAEFRDLASLAKEMRQCLETLAKLQGLMGPDVQVNVLNSPVFVKVMGGINDVVAECDHCGPRVERLLEEA